MWNDLVSEPRNRSIECHLGLIPMGQLYFILWFTCVIFCIIHLQNHNIWVFLLCLNFIKFILFCLFSFDKTMRKKCIYNSFCISVKFKNCTRFFVFNNATINILPFEPLCRFDTSLVWVIIWERTEILKATVCMLTLIVPAVFWIWTCKTWGWEIFVRNWYVWHVSMAWIKCQNCILVINASAHICWSLWT